MVTESSGQLVILTGMSGAGKTTALRCFEDLGYLCIDNLPPSLISTFITLYRQTPGGARDIAVVCDVRSGELFSSFRAVISELRERGESCLVVFLDCEDDVLITRFKEARRVPPLGTNLRIEEAVALERERLDPVKELADYAIDTTNLVPKQLRSRMLELFSSESGRGQLTVTILSFGYKFGVPADADFVLDSRFLPNPFYVEGLRDLTGESEQVRHYVLNDELARDYIERTVDLLQCALPHYADVHKHSAVVAIGCTGGVHRSVALANYLADVLKEKGIRVVLQHRDMERL